MFQNMEIVNQPIFYLFIALTFILTLGYYWGSRRNNNIANSTLGFLVDILKPKDQTFTRIGGLTGYHANIIPKNNSIINKVDATIILLPRHAWLYLPFSFLFIRNDKLYNNIELKPKKANFKEGHILNKAYYKFKGPKITNENQLQKEDILWNGKKYIIFYKDTETKNILLNITELIKDPRAIKHIALVPGDNRVHLYLIPEYKKIAEYLNKIYKWVFDLIER